MASTRTAPLRRPGPGQRGGHGDRVQAGAVAVLRRSAVPALVATRRTLPANVVPGRGLVPAPWRQPVGERDKNDAARPGHPHHLGQHRAPVRHVFQHVGGEAHVDGAGRQREAHRAADHTAGLRAAEAGQFPAVGIQAYHAGAGRAELAGEVPRPTADVGHHLPGQVQVLAELAGGVAAEAGVVQVRVRLLGAERPQQPGRPGHIRPEGGTIAHEDVCNRHRAAPQLERVTFEGLSEAFRSPVRQPKLVAGGAVAHVSATAGGRRARAGCSRRRPMPGGSPRRPGWTTRHRRSPGRSRYRRRLARPRAWPG